MADRIKGITIEIGGDTTKLQNALKDVNKQLKDTQSDLRDVDKLLKLDPKNTELLTQKHELLGKAVGDTKDRLETLKKAQEQMKSAGVDKSSEEYQRLSREIIECEQSLKKLEKQAVQSNVTLQKIGATGQQLKSVGNSISGVGQKVSVASAAVATGMGAAVKTTMDFDTQMSKVKALSKDITDDQFEALRNKAREMGKETRFSATEAAQGLEYMALAGWSVDDMLVGLEPVLNLAIASGTDLGTTSDIVTDALTAFGKSAQDTEPFVDLLAQTSRVSNTNVEMLGESFKYVAPVMGAMGYSTEDTAIALGLMANSGIKASQAGTSLRGIITRLASPTKESANAIETLGIKLDDGEGNMLSFYDVMTQMRAGFGDLKISEEELNTSIAELDAQLEDGTLTEKKYDEAVAELMEQAYGAEGALKAQAAAQLAGKNALSGLLAIVNASDKDFQEMTNNILASNGAAEEMRKTMSDNLGGDMDKLKSSLQELAISLGDILIPYVKQAVEWIQGLVDKFNGMSDGQKKIILAIGALVVVLGPLLIILGNVISIIGQVMIFMPMIVGAMAPLGAAIGALFGPLGIVIALVGAIIAVGVLVIKHWDDLKAKMHELGQSMAEGWENIKQKSSDALDKMKTTASEKWEGIKSTFKNGIENIQNWWSNMKLQFPKIKLPHFKLSGSFSLNPPSVPSIGIDWYKKAYDDAYLLNSPTIFGSAGGKLLGGGEGNGSEAVVGTDKLMSMISDVMGTMNVNVVLEGDANGVFNLVRTENTRFVKSNGYSPLS